MGNLFLREKESWFAWSIWGLVGAVISFIAASMTQQPIYILMASLAIVLILTWWMNSTKRFDFGRAFKVSFYVLTFSCLPNFMLLIVPSKNLNQVEIVIQLVGFILISVVSCLLFSWIARRPKQYY